MRGSRFSSCHPGVLFAFFVAAVLGSVTILHPVYLAVSFFAAAALYLTERGLRGLRAVGAMAPLFLLLSAVNPLFNTEGERVLFTLFGRPYTLEALYYGMAVAAMLVTALLWFFSYNLVMTGEKFTCLFGNLIPALSLLLTMVLRMVPSYRKKAGEISGARRCVGLTARPGDGLRKRVESGMNVLSALTGWALEGAVVTADSMRSRGYGAAKRTGFRLYRFTAADGAMALSFLLLLSGLVASAYFGWTAVEYTPRFTAAPLTGVSLLGPFSYGLFLLLPALLNLWEAIKWQFFQSKI